MSRLLVALVVATGFLVAVQVDVLAHIRVFGVVIMLVWLWPLCLGLLGAGQGAVIAGVVGGLCFDAHAATTFGINGVVSGVIAATAVRLERNGIGDVDGAAWWTAPALASVTGLVAPLLLVVVAALTLDFSLWRGSLLMTMVVNAVAFAVVARPLVVGARALTGLSPARR